MTIRSTLACLATAAVACTCGVPATEAETATPARTPACSTPEYRQFDFWLGDWEVRDPSGKIAGRNRIVATNGGCALQENWTGNGGFTGTSLNVYDGDRKRWHQTWVDNSGSLLQLDGEFAGGRMVLQGESPDASGKIVRQRITWQLLPDGRVRQLWESSKDSGATWTVAFDGFYAKR